jgi:ADP-ribose pyrophosphatase
VKEPRGGENGVGREEVLGSRRGFDGKRVRVRVDEVRLPSGRETVREVVEHPGAVAVVAVTEDGRLLLIRQFHHAIGRALLGIPAGTLEPDEPPIETARRELIEETGYAAGGLSELVAFYPSPGYTDERLIVFLAEGCRPTGAGPNPDELIDLVPVPLSDVPDLLAAGTDRIEEAKTLIGLLWFLRFHPPGDAAGAAAP